VFEEEQVACPEGVSDTGADVVHEHPQDNENTCDEPPPPSVKGATTLVCDCFLFIYLICFLIRNCSYQIHSLQYWKMEAPNLSILKWKCVMEHSTALFLFRGHVLVWYTDK
jgi:hypothetical protein